MQRLREHRTNLTKLLKDERLLPNTRALMALMAMYLDADAEPRAYKGAMTPEKHENIESTKRDKMLLHNVIAARFGNSKRIQWTDGEDYGLTEGDGTERSTLLEIAANEKIKSAFAFIEETGTKGAQ